MVCFVIARLEFPEVRDCIGNSFIFQYSSKLFEIIRPKIIFVFIFITVTLIIAALIYHWNRFSFYIIGQVRVRAVKNCGRYWQRLITDDARTLFIPRLCVGIQRVRASQDCELLRRKIDFRA